MPFRTGRLTEYEIANLEREVEELRRSKQNLEYELSQAKRNAEDEISRLKRRIAELERHVDEAYNGGYEDGKADAERGVA